MFSKTEMQQLKRDFWVNFSQAYPRRWLLYNTKIKDLALKFEVQHRSASVMIEISHRNVETRRLYFNKIASLNQILKEEFHIDAIFDEHVTLETGKIVARIFVSVNGISTANRSSWPTIYTFFNTQMTAFELFFDSYADFIRTI